MTVVDGSPIEAPARRRLIPIARLALAAAWVLWAALAWWTAPRLVNSDRLDADLAAGRVASYALGDAWERPDLWGGPPDLRRFGGDRLLAWKTTNGQTFYFFTISDPSYVDKLERANVSGRWLLTMSPTASSIAILLALIALAVLIRGPNPARGTRWFWFWVGQLPFGLGLLAWLRWERPWSNPQTPPAKRKSGWAGFAYLLLGGLACSLLVIGGRRVFGDWLFPH